MLILQICLQIKLIYFCVSFYFCSAVYITYRSTGLSLSSVNNALPYALFNLIFFSGCACCLFMQSTLYCLHSDVLHHFYSLHPYFTPILVAYADMIFDRVGKERSEGIQGCSSQVYRRAPCCFPRTHGRRGSLQCARSTTSGWPATSTSTNDQCGGH